MNSSSEHKEHLKRLISIKSQGVSVLDSQTNETTVYPSLSDKNRYFYFSREQSGGVGQGNISNAFKRKSGILPF